jgi:uncharacterized protein (TIGR03435 family)
MYKQLLATAALTALLNIPAQSQPVAFEVASIRPIGDTVHIAGMSIPRAKFSIDHAHSSEPLPGIAGNNYSVQNVTLTDLVIDAYNVRLDQISGAPKWATPDGDMYEIRAKAAGEMPPTSDQIRRMLQSLLADRFELKLHRETKNLSVYDLTIGKSGSKLKEISAELPPGTLSATAPGVPERFIADMLAGFLDHPVVDKTGLTGKRYKLDWDQTDLLAERRQGFKPPPSIFSAVQDQLGLKLELKNGPAEVLVIDHAAKPSEN